MKIIVTLCMAVVMLFVGCGAASGARTIENRASASIKNGTTKSYTRQTPYRQYNALASAADLPEEKISETDRARKITARLSKIDGLNKATVVITGNTAIVGLELEGEPDDNTLIQTKRRIEREVKAEDKGIDRVAVTAAPDLVKRILDMAGSDNGSEIEDAPRYSEKTEDIITRLTPVV